MSRPTAPQQYPSSEPDLVLKPKSMQNRVFVYPILFLAGIGCAALIVVSSLGHLGITDRRSQTPELVASSVVLMVVILFVLIIARMKTVCHGSVIWRHYGILRPKRKVLVDLDEADEAYVHRLSAGRYPTIQLDFLNADGEIIAIGPSLPHFRHRDQRKFHEYLTRYVRVTGEWQLFRSTFIQTSTHPPRPSA